MRLADLYGKQVRTAGGERLGRVHEVCVREGAVATLDCGAGSWLERMTGRGRARKVAWERVKRVGAEIVVAD